MIGFEYKYNSSSEILNNIKTVAEYSNIEYSILALLSILLIIFIYYIIPVLNIIINKNKIDQKVKNKKELLRLIVIQKNINDEIEKELNIH